MSKIVPYLAEEAIEQDAVILLRDFALAWRVAIQPPIPIEDIAEKHLKLSIDFDDLHSLFDVRRSGAGPGSDILGAMFFSEARIVIDESLDPETHPASEGRYRFTLAHEAGGHWRLHRHLFEKEPRQSDMFGRLPVPSVVCRSSQAKERIEWQADFYASCLLMPRELVFRAWHNRFGTYDPFVYELHKNSPIASGFRSTWVHFSEALASALGLEVQDHQDCFDRISREFTGIFNVSTEAMRIRLEKLGLLLREVPRQRTLAAR